MYRSCRDVSRATSDLLRGIAALKAALGRLCPSSCELPAPVTEGTVRSPHTASPLLSRGAPLEQVLRKNEGKEPTRADAAQTSQPAAFPSA